MTSTVTDGNDRSREGKLGPQRIYTIHASFHRASLQCKYKSGQEYHFTDPYPQL